MKNTGAVYEVRTYGSVRGMRHEPHPTRCGKILKQVQDDGVTFRMTELHSG